MGDNVKIDRDVFHKRLGELASQWKNDKRQGGASFAGAGAIVCLMGKNEDAGGFHKNGALQFWLLGYEFPATLMVFTPEVLHIITTRKKASYLEPLKGGKIPVEISVRGKDVTENKGQFQAITELLKKAGKVGVLSKAPASGPFVDEWLEVYNPIKSDIDEVDVSEAISEAALATKSEDELRAVREASRASCAVLTHYFLDEMTAVLDEEKKVSHKAFSDKIYNKIEDPKFLLKQMQKFAASNSFSTKDFDPLQLDWATPPLIQSGGDYDLKFTKDADNQNIHGGVLVASLGFRYNSYASCVARTYLVDPNKSQENAYKIVLAARDAALKEIRDGGAAKTVYEKAIGVIKSKKPEFEKHFVKDVGAGVGLEARDATFILNGKTERTLRNGMTFTLSIGLTDLENPQPQDKRSSKYSILLVDTVRVSQAGDAVFVLTNAGSEFDQAVFTFRDDDQEEERKTSSKPKKDSRIGSVAQSNVTKTRLRNERSTNVDAEKEAARRAHQKELHAKKQQEGMARFPDETGAMNGVEEKKFKKFESYKRDNQFPSKVENLIVCVDERSQTVNVPIMGRPVPFHIHSIKNASRNDEGGFTYLRINFLSPGQGIGRKEDQPFEDPSAHFVRSLTFRSKDFDRMEGIVKQITDLKKASVRREQEKKEMEDVVEQDKLIEVRNRKPHRNEPVFLRPPLEGKRLPGAVEIHQNGLRYTHAGGAQKVDILFSNVKHLFFQPCDHELIVIIHVYLISPIIVGKKKTKEVQFYREATEMAFDETGNRKRKHRYGDEEEFEQEQEERRRRAALNKEFKGFAERISDAGRAEGLSVDMPFRELGFNGVPSRSNVLVQPTTDCLVQLIEPPFLVVTLSDLEVVHLERVQYGLKNFDMVLVPRDFTKPPIHINTIPVESLDAVKDWLDSVDIPFSEGPLNLNWTAIMKTLTADPHAFFDGGGWKFLSVEDDDDDDEEEESEESAFEVSDEELADLSQESSDEESDFDEDASADDDEDEDMDEDDEGEDWDEMERKAKKKDKESGLEDEDRRKPSKGKKK